MWQSATFFFFFFFFFSFLLLLFIYLFLLQHTDSACPCGADCRCEGCVCGRLLGTLKLDSANNDDAAVGSHTLPLPLPPRLPPATVVILHDQQQSSLLSNSSSPPPTSAASISPQLSPSSSPSPSPSLSSLVPVSGLFLSFSNAMQPVSISFTLMTTAAADSPQTGEGCGPPAPAASRQKGAQHCGQCQGTAEKEGQG